jgi:hypothetical protein
MSVGVSKFGSKSPPRVDGRRDPIKPRRTTRIARVLIVPVQQATKK